MEAFYSNLQPYNSFESSWVGGILRELKHHRDEDELFVYFTKSICTVLGCLAMVISQPVITIGRTVHQFTRWDFNSAANAICNGWKNELFFIVSCILLPAILFYSLFDGSSFFENLNLSDITRDQAEINRLLEALRNQETLTAQGDGQSSSSRDDLLRPIGSSPSQKQGVSSNEHCLDAVVDLQLLPSSSDSQ